MAWFWTKKKPANTNSNAAVDAHGSTGVVTPAAPDAQAAVDAAVASAQQSDKEWRRQAARLREEEKRREKEREREAKQQLAEMKKQARAARKERARAEKLAEKQTKTVLKVHRRQQKADRQRVKAMAKVLHAAEKRRKRLLRKRQKEERRRRKQVRAQDARAPEPELVVAETPALDRGATTTPLQAPVFKEDKCCNACHSQFKRLPTRRRHHCRNCGESFCSKCLSGVKRPIPWFKLDKPQKVCFSCDVQVFNGMGGAARPNRSERSNTAASPLSSSSTAPVSTRVEAAQVPPEPEQRSRSPLRAERSASFQSEQPEDESPRTTSPPLSRSGLSFRLRPRSRRDGNSSKSKKNSLWTLPIRPLLKRKASADQLRNRTWDLDLRIAKEAMLARQRQSQMIVVTGAPQFATAS